ncbi:hypothetical protein OsI_36873 [Oryza sativa Indica Group]|uniref:Uncharacterized protein n=1 Tax=Oryza sativa subsp. indica TaxID=39946 RepID=B8BLM2_ORYSI|nr:hypothetical protein OsI_36873 [Oryza sativa Indica Group]
MDGEQEARWLAAQGVAVGADLVAAALRQLEFLAAVDRRRWLYEGPLLERAIHRYKTCWLPLLAKHTQAAVVDGPLVVPLDCEWIWHCHRLNPVDTPTMHDQRFLEEALARYKGFLYLIKTNQENKMKLFRVPTYDVDVIWHTHQLHPATYCHDMLKLIGRVLEHDDTDDDRSEGKKLDTGFSGTTKQFENAFGARYWKAGAMYRGNLPSPVTSNPQMFISEVDGEFSVGKAESQITILETTVIELFLQIVDIKNLPPAIPKENVYIWFTKNQPDMFISDGGRLDISTKTGKSIGASIQCEPTGELILTVLVDRESSSKKPKKIGKISIPLQEFTWSDSKLSFERWFELKPHDGHASSPIVSLRVAASSTVPVKAQQVLSMIRTEPFSLKSFLSPNSIKDQKMSCWTHFVYDCNTELIRLQIRDQKAKNGMVVARELVGVTKSSKKPFKLAEFVDNKWSLSNSNLCITNDMKPSKDGSILELKCDNKTGKRLEFQRKCCNNHAEENASAITAVKFSAEHPYGKAVALLDTKSELIMTSMSKTARSSSVAPLLRKARSLSPTLLPWRCQPRRWLLLLTAALAARRAAVTWQATRWWPPRDARPRDARLSRQAAAAAARQSRLGAARDAAGGCGGGVAKVVEATKAGVGRPWQVRWMWLGLRWWLWRRQGAAAMAVESSKDDVHAKCAGCGSGCGRQAVAAAVAVAWSWKPPRLAMSSPAGAGIRLRRRLWWRLRWQAWPWKAHKAGHVKSGGCRLRLRRRLWWQDVCNACFRELEDQLVACFPETVRTSSKACRPSRFLVFWQGVQD